VAATCLGHLAIIHRQLDIELVLPRLAEMKSDAQVAARVEDALEDIKFFLRFQWAEPVTSNILKSRLIGEAMITD
jgi:hypothetical protein